MTTPGRVAAHLDAVAAVLTGAERALLLTGTDPTAFGAAAPGRAGDLGGALHARLTEALSARAREAARAAGHLTDTADALRATAERYADTDDAAARRLDPEA